MKVIADVHNYIALRTIATLGVLFLSRLLVAKLHMYLLTYSLLIYETDTIHFVRFV